VEPFFIHREAIDELSHHDMSQERTTLRLFLDICGDRAINAHGRAVGGHQHSYREAHADHAWRGGRV
jgi:hypothetical protein